MWQKSNTGKLNKWEIQKYPSRRNKNNVGK